METLSKSCAHHGRAHAQGRLLKFIQAVTRRNVALNAIISIIHINAINTVELRRLLGTRMLWLHDKDLELQMLLVVVFQIGVRQLNLNCKQPLVRTFELSLD